MNKEQKIKQLTWEYFWKQKKKEVCKFFKVVFCIVKVIPILIFFGAVIVSTFFAIGYLICILFPEASGESFYKYESILKMNFIINITGWIYWGLVYWLHINWEKAKEKATRKVKK